MEFVYEHVEGECIKHKTKKASYEQPRSFWPSSVKYVSVWALEKVRNFKIGFQINMIISRWHFFPNWTQSIWTTYESEKDKLFLTKQNFKNYSRAWKLKLLFILFQVLVSLFYLLFQCFFLIQFNENGIKTRKKYMNLRKNYQRSGSHYSLDTNVYFNWQKWKITATFYILWEYYSPYIYIYIHSNGRSFAKGCDLLHPLYVLCETSLLAYDET